MTKFIIVTGGVLSGLGKGVTTAAIGLILRSRGLRIDVCKIDPYLNVDPGLMNPFQHGEVWVTKDGYEADLDFGHYERFLDVELTRDHNITTGKIYLSVLEKERRGEYLGQTVQIIPHVTDEIKQQLMNIARKSNPDVLIVEIGGTTGDIESMPFLEALRQLRMELGRENVLFIHVTLVPVLDAVGEQKTKPTQHSVKELRSIGIQPDVLVCRCREPLLDETKAKLSLYCDVSKRDVISNHDVEVIYEVPLIMEEQGIGDTILEKLNLRERAHDLKEWRSFVSRIKQVKEKVSIAMVGKYTHLHDSYISVVEALKHAAWKLERRVEVLWVEAERLEEGEEDALSGADGILVPGGFGVRGSEGKISAIRYAREHGIPYLGICFGFQLAVVEFARNVAGLAGANSTELDPGAEHPVIDLLPEQRGIDRLGGTMRLGEIEVSIKPGTLAHRIYGCESVGERHRHRYEVNPEYIPLLERHGLVFSATSDSGRRMEICELPSHPHFIATQFHPEFRSRPLKPAPVFLSFVSAAAERRRSRDA